MGLPLIVAHLVAVLPVVATGSIRCVPEAARASMAGYRATDVGGSHHTIGMLDFDDWVHSWYAADITFALRDLFAEGVDLGHHSFRAFVGGYRTQHPLDDDLLTRVPLFFRLANLLQYARVVHVLDLPSQPSQPAWLQTLQTKLRGRVEAYRRSLSG